MTPTSFVGGCTSVYYQVSKPLLSWVQPGPVEDDFVDLELGQGQPDGYRIQFPPLEPVHTPQPNGCDKVMQRCPCIFNCGTCAFILTGALDCLCAAVVDESKIPIIIVSSVGCVVTCVLCCCTSDNDE